MERQASQISRLLGARGIVKVTLIRPHYFSVWESLALGYIASYLKKHYQGKLEINFFDGFFDSDKEIIEGSVNSDFVAFSCTSPQMKHALSLAKAIKEENPEIYAVFGGHHPSSLEADTIANQQVDIVVVGEGETGMLGVLNDWDKYGKAGKEKQFPQCLVYPSDIIDDLDSIPFPDRKLIRQDRTLALTEKNDGERIASVLSGRGCPFHCVFCTGDHDVFGSKVRKRTVGNMLDEIKQLVHNWHIDFLKFADAEINTNMFWVQAFCAEKFTKGITVPWGANIHAAIMDRTTLEFMKKANCREIWVGVESGSPKILKEMGKGINIQQIENVFKWAKECDIRTRAYFMVGHENETREDFDMTLKLAEKLDADIYGCTVLAPFPGTEIYDRYKEKLNLQNTDWSSVDEYGNKIWETENFSNEELLDLQAEFTEKFKDRLCFRQRDELK